MKRQKYYSSSGLASVIRILLIGCLGLLAWTPMSGQGVELSRVIEKTFSVDDQSVLEVINKYGKIHVNTSRDKRAFVRIEIVSKANKSERAQQRLNEVSIRERELGNKIQLESLLKASPIGNSINKIFDRGVSVSYEISLPSKVALEISNKFGDVYMDDRYGNVHVEIDYGKLIAERLMGTSNSVDLEFGDLDIDQIEGGDINFSFGQVDIGQAGDIYLKSNSANVRIDKVNKLEIQANMGKTQIERVDDISGKLSSSFFELERLEKSMALEVKYATAFRVESISKDFERIDLQGHMSPFNLNFDSDTPFDLDAQIEFGNLRLDDADGLSTFQEKNINTYKGQFGKARASRLAKHPRVSIKSKYGNVKIGR